MNSVKQYRDRGAVGAILDEYEKAVEELKLTIQNVSSTQLTSIVDRETDDEDCRSIQSILSHVVRAGHNYVIVIRKHQHEEKDYVNTILHNSIQQYQLELDKMFAENVRLFDDYPSIQIEVHDEASKIHVSWGQRYDIEQLMEHAIVHILRHRRQIERFLLKL